MSEQAKEFDPADATTWPDHLVIGTGIVAAAVCTRGTDEEAEAFINATSPTGISSPWRVSPNTVIPWHDDPKPQPGERPCPDDPARRHVGMSC